MTDQLDNLSAQAAQLEASSGQPGTNQVPAAAGPEAQQAAMDMAKLEAGVTSVVLAALKLGRAWLEKRLPEIREEWTDDVLKEPAAAAVPLLFKHLGSLMQVIGKSPETAAFAMACFPLAMGVVTAMDKASEREKREAQALQQQQAAPA